MISDDIQAGMIDVPGGQIEFLQYPGQTANILMLGGGANLQLKESYYPEWQASLAERGIGNLSFNYRGVGASSGELGNTSLMTRLEDARAAAKQVGAGCLFISGVSMGAPLAIRLANELQAEGLILISPAAYASDAYLKSFGPELTEVLRRDKSWEGSPDFHELEQFKGKILLAYGKADEVIPPSVLEKYAEIVKDRGSVLAFNGVGHRFMREDNSKSESARQLLNNAIQEMVYKT